MNKLNYNEKLFIAGYFEAQGCLNNHKNYYKKELMSISTRLIFSNKDLGAIKNLHKILGVGIIGGPYRMGDRQSSFYRLTINDKPEILEFISTIEPYLSDKRKTYLQNKLAKTQNWTFRKKIAEKICPVCGKLFKPRPKTKICCSRKCSVENSKKDRVILHCATCGKEVLRTLKDHQYRLQKIGCKRTFCGSVCSGKYYHNRRKG